MHTVLTPMLRGTLAKTPLHTAVSENASEAVEVLLAHGADPTAEDNSGETPLHTAASEYRYRLDAVEALLAHDADPNDHGEFDITLFERKKKEFEVRADAISSGYVSRMDFKAYIRYAVVKVFRATAEKLCQSVNLKA